MKTQDDSPDSAVETDLADVFKILAPLTTVYPEEAVGELQAFDSYGIVLKQIDGSAISQLVIGSIPDGPAAFQVAKSMSALAFTDAWNAIMQTTVLYNGAISDIDDPNIDVTRLPNFSENLLILEPVDENVFTSRLYFNYN